MRALSSRSIAAAVAVLACSVVTADPVAGERDHTAPTRTQLNRLYHLDPYIRYFSALSYGDPEAVVPEAYVRALILSESAGDRWAHSVKGARGLTQILPSTGRAASAELAESDVDFRYIDERKLASFSPDLLFDPALNLLIACYVNAGYHRMYGGRPDLMAAAWNAGPAAVERNDQQMPAIPETKRFVERVLSYMRYFERAAAASPTF